MDQSATKTNPFNTRHSLSLASPDLISQQPVFVTARIDFWLHDQRTVKAAAGVNPSHASFLVREQAFQDIVSSSFIVDGFRIRQPPEIVCVAGGRTHIP